MPKVYARQNLDPTNLGGLIDLVGNIALGDAKARSADVLGHVFEYFLGEFALAEGKTRNRGHLINRRTRKLSEEDIICISETYHKWRSAPTPGPSREGNIIDGSSREGDIISGLSRKGSISASGKKKKSLPGEGGSESREGYTDIPGFCNSASIERVRELDYVLTPGRYVGLPDEEEEDFDFNERFTTLKKEFEEQLKEEARLNALIAENLKKVKLS
ncbi:MAG: hypothetical protein MRK01_10120 [Candidatus Scalindua sp.]|nr:hypothetical protein [Candidatus Scalindua sp.]